jgi:spermidine synthase
MIPWELLDTAYVPGRGEALRLLRRGAEYSIMSGSVELMNSRLSGSEEALAELACARVASRPAPAILIGGLGMGFTLVAALAALGPLAKVTVAELVPAVVAWARGPLAHITGGALGDGRVSVLESDVGALIRSGRAAFDAIVLDVDNGPHGLSRAENDGLYSRAGLCVARRALRPGGVLAIWSSAPEPAFARRLRDEGFAVEEIALRARKSGRGARRLIWIATSPTGGA